MADFERLPASGRRVEFHGTSSVEVKRGLMQRIWIDMDMSGPSRHMTSSPGGTQ